MKHRRRWTHIICRSRKDVIQLHTAVKGTLCAVFLHKSRGLCDSWGTTALMHFFAEDEVYVLVMSESSTEGNCCFNPTLPDLWPLQPFKNVLRARYRFRRVDDASVMDICWLTKSMGRSVLLHCRDSLAGGKQQCVLPLMAFRCY